MIMVLKGGKMKINVYIDKDSTFLAFSVLFQFQGGRMKSATVSQSYITNAYQMPALSHMPYVC